MTMPRFRALKREWDIRPPVSWLIARFLGYKPPPSASASPPSESQPSLAALKSLFPDGRIV